MSDPREKLHSFEAGLDLLNAAAKQWSDLNEETQRRIGRLRNSYHQKLLMMLRDTRGGTTSVRLDCARILLLKMKAEVENTRSVYSAYTMLFPQPRDGACLDISPPGLAWLPVKGAACYDIEIRNADGVPLYKKIIGTEPVHLPDRIFPQGAYTWDVVALDVAGIEIERRGELSFTIVNNAHELPWIQPKALLAKIPREHPRFLYLKRDLPSIRATLRTTRQRSWKACLGAAKRALAIPLPSYPDHDLAKSNLEAQLEAQKYARELSASVAGALMPLSLAFLMTGHEKYAEAAKSILLLIAGWPTGDYDVTSVSARWGDEPGLILAGSLHRAYDWLHDALSEQERFRVRSMCEARAWQAYRRLIRHNYLSNPGESHNGRLIPYLAEMAIVMAGESEGAETWLDYSLKALTTIYPHWGAQDGGWAEGVAYAASYNALYLPAFETLRETADFDLCKRPFVRKLRYFFYYCAALRGEMTPFGDGAEQGGLGTINGSQALSVLRYHAARFSDPYIGWWVNQFPGSDIKADELSLVFVDSLRQKQPDSLPESRVFRDIGWAALHSDLSRPSEDTFLLFKSSPFGSVSHSHADQNAFCIFKGGTALAIPSGHYGPLAGAPHHIDWTSTTKANNCILVDGQGQPVKNRQATGRIIAFEHRGKSTYVAGDATAAYPKHVKRLIRHILFLPPGLILLLDDLQTKEPAIFQWMLHALDEMEIDSAIGWVRSQREGATLDIHLRSTTNLSFHQTDQFDTPFNSGIPKSFHQKTANHWHVTVETTDRKDLTRIGAVMAVRGPHERLELEVFQQGGWFYAMASGDFGRVQGCLQLEPQAPGPHQFGTAAANGNTTLCGVASDGAQFVAPDTRHLKL